MSSDEYGFLFHALTKSYRGLGSRNHVMLDGAEVESNRVRHGLHGLVLRRPLDVRLCGVMHFLSKLWDTSLAVSYSDIFHFRCLPNSSRLVVSAPDDLAQKDVWSVWVLIMKAQTGQLYLKADNSLASDFDYRLHVRCGFIS